MLISFDFSVELDFSKNHFAFLFVGKEFSWLK